MKELIYVLTGKQFFFVEKQLEKMLDEYKNTDCDIVRYDMEETALDDLIQELQTISFFSNEKIVIVKNIEKMESKKADRLKSLYAYLKRPSSDIKLIFLIQDLIEQNELNAELKKYAYIDEVETIEKDDFSNFIIRTLKNDSFQIDEKAALELALRTDYDLYMLDSEIAKLKLYSYDTKKITIELIKELVSKNLEDNIYELTRYVLNDEIDRAYDVFKDLMQTNEEPLKIINQLGQRVRELMYTKDLLNEHYNQEQIAEYFNYKKGRAYFLIKDAKNVRTDKLEYLLSKLSQLDFKIKSGAIDKKIGLELLILGSV